jgi:hypothetical protein
MVAPFHGIVFGSMVRNIVQAAENVEAASPRSADNRHSTPSTHVR